MEYLIISVLMISIILILKFGLDIKIKDIKKIKKLGYDASQPFFNYPSEMRFKYNSWDTYYCDEPSLLYTNKPMASNVGQASAYAGAFHLMSSAGWTATFYNRLCYRPISS